LSAVVQATLVPHVVYYIGRSNSSIISSHTLTLPLSSLTVLKYVLLTGITIVVVVAHRCGVVAITLASLSTTRTALSSLASAVGIGVASITLASLAAALSSLASAVGIGIASITLASLAAALASLASAVGIGIAL
jgi:hypothetical protein